ncbi:hypothetical protein K32_24430 [Kaistia sp. 32K]|nr:hypothetical protein K32_24430 [Kaistia sp. 32K]
MQPVHIAIRAARSAFVTEDPEPAIAGACSVANAARAEFLASVIPNRTAPAPTGAKEGAGAPEPVRRAV